MNSIIFEIVTKVKESRLWGYNNVDPFNETSLYALYYSNEFCNKSTGKCL